MDATCSTSTHLQRAQFPPQVRGCYVGAGHYNCSVPVSSSGARMLRVSMKRAVFKMSFPLGYADVTVIDLPVSFICGILVSYNLRRYE